MARGALALLCACAAVVEAAPLAQAAPTRPQKQLPIMHAWPWQPGPASVPLSSHAAAAPSLAAPPPRRSLTRK